VHSDVFGAKLAKMLAIHAYLKYFRYSNILNASMAQILAFAGSNSSTSINFKMVKYTAGLIDGHSIQLLNMANILKLPKARVNRKSLKPKT